MWERFEHESWVKEGFGVMIHLCLVKVRTEEEQPPKTTSLPVLSLFISIRTAVLLWKQITLTLPCIFLCTFIDAVALIIRKGCAQLSSLTLPAWKGPFYQQSAHFPFSLIQTQWPFTLSGCRKYHMALIHMPSLHSCHIPDPYCKKTHPSPLILSPCCPCVCIFQEKKREKKGVSRCEICMSALSRS